MYCTNCGNELPENSKFCNHCGALQSKPAKEQGTDPQPEQQATTATQKRKAPNKKPGCMALAIFLILIFIIIMCVNGISDEKKSEGSSSPNESAISTTAEAPIEISASKLIQAYIDNEVKADTIYDEKQVIISGYVDRIDQTDYLFSENELIVYVGTGDSIENCVRCYISEDQKDIVAELEKGDKITVMGKCVGVGSSYFNLKCVNIYRGEIVS